MTSPAMQDDTLFQHIKALRQMLVRVFIATGLCFSVTAWFAKDLYRILASPLTELLPQNAHFITIHPVEAWLTYLKTALFAAAFLATPVFFYELWRFISPGLFNREKKIFVGFFTGSALLFMSGALFGYFVMFPFGFRYFTEVLEGTNILFLPRMEDYLGFACQLLLASGIIFETPLLMILLTASGILTRSSFVAFRRYFIVIAFIIAAILTPPDVVSQTLMAVPLMLLYEVGVVGAWIVEKRAVNTADLTAPD